MQPPVSGHERVDGAAVVSVICVTLARGRGTDDDVVRIVKQYYSPAGEFLAEHDPCPPKGAR